MLVYFCNLQIWSYLDRQDIKFTPSFLGDFIFFKNFLLSIVSESQSTLGYGENPDISVFSQHVNMPTRYTDLFFDV